MQTRPDETRPAAVGASRLGLFGVTAVFGLGLVWLSLAVSIEGVFAADKPDLAVKVWPLGAQARAELSSQLLAQQPTAPRVRSLAEGALLREPLEAKAASVLALSYAAEGDQQRSTRLHRYAENLSRRDVEAQLLLIEERVRQNDIHGALLHYDRALRVSNRVRDILLPVLVQASEYSPVARELAPLLVVRPPWWADYLDRLIENGSPRAIASVVLPLRLSANDESERGRLEWALRKLAAAGELGAATEIYRQARSATRAEALIRDGSFEEEPLLPPFEWWLATGADLAAARESREGADGQFALSLIRRGGKTGEVANQLLQLAPGRYKLRAKVGAISGSSADHPRIQLHCANNQRDLTDLVLREAPESGASFSGEFVVPEGCRGQWLSILASSGVDVQEGTPWIDDLALEKIDS